MGNVIAAMAGDAISGASGVAVSLVATIVGAVAGAWGTLKVLSHRVNEMAEVIKEIKKWHTARKLWESEFEKKLLAWEIARELEEKHEAELAQARRSASDSMIGEVTRPHRKATR